MNAARHMNPVSIDDLAEYPLDSELRLDTHSYFQWEFRRWMSSDMRWNGTHECKSMWFELLNIAHGETPVGTLPGDLRRLAKMIEPSVDPAHFEGLCQLEFGPLHGWVKCRCDDEIRWMHPVVTRVVLEALASRSVHQARSEAASREMRLRRLTRDVGVLAPDLARDARKIVWIDNQLQEVVSQRGGKRRTEQELHAAIQGCIAEARKGRFPKVDRAS